jgi:hypothetical protein
MKRLSKNYLFVIRKSRSQILFGYILFLTLVFSEVYHCQITNYVSNGSFESLNSNSVTSKYNVVNYWQPIDTGKFCDYLVTLIPPIANGPKALGYQYPRTGQNYLVSTFFASYPTQTIGYPRNRLKSKLKSNTVYCAKYYIVATNNSPLVIDGYDICFADSTLDTINYCNRPLSFLLPQIKNPTGNIISDTLNWIAITGTFTAKGTEKYMVLGNFRSAAATTTLIGNSNNTLSTVSDICIDDVSCIELNLSAFAGRDTNFILGDSLFLGREPDVGIDEACIWYKLPGTVPIDTIAGFWIKPTATSTYVVRQEICGLVKWDTVVVYMDGVGIQKNELNVSEMKLFPNPASESVRLQLNKGLNGYCHVVLLNNLAQKLREEDLKFENSTASFDVREIPTGIYSLKIAFGNQIPYVYRIQIDR